MTDAKQIRIQTVKQGYEIGLAFTPLRGKIPYLSKWNTRTRSTEAEALAWAKEGNIGIILGSQSGVICVDFDNHPTFDDIPDTYPKTTTVKTARWNMHLPSTFLLSDRPILPEFSTLASSSQY